MPPIGLNMWETTGYDDSSLVDVVFKPYFAPPSYASTWANHGTIHKLEKGDLEDGSADVTTVPKPEMQDLHYYV